MRCKACDVMIEWYIQVPWYDEDGEKRTAWEPLCHECERKSSSHHVPGIFGMSDEELVAAIIEGTIGVSKY
jgi:hypothetical protein